MVVYMKTGRVFGIH